VVSLANHDQYRKGAVSTASPRTPNVNQINSKKQRSQLARFPLAVATSSSMPIDRNDPFLVPPSPPAKQVYSPASLNKSLRDQVNSLRNQLKDGLFLPSS
jgi:hypothetical protein